MTYKSTRRGFTLIELLVVVLIIGILAAVAVPQYRKAVEKTRAMEAFSLLKSVSNAMDAYYLANGKWPTSFDELDIDIPWTGRDSHGSVDSRSNNQFTMELYLDSNGVSRTSVFHLNGKFAGAGFSITKENNNDPLSHSLVGKYFCKETLDGKIPFALDPGDFCVKIIGGTHFKSFSWGRYYTLP